MTGGRAFALTALLAGCEPDPAPEPFFPAGFADTWPEVRGCRNSIDHDMVFVTVYASPEAAQAYLDGTYPFDPEAVLVKRQFRDASCTMLEGYTAMRRLPDGEAPELENWEWQRVDADGKVAPANQEACAACHRDCTEGRDGTCTDGPP